MQKSGTALITSANTSLGEKIVVAISVLFLALILAGLMFAAELVAPALVVASFTQPGGNATGVNFSSAAGTQG